VGDEDYWAETVETRSISIGKFTYLGTGTQTRSDVLRLNGRAENRAGRLRVGDSQFLMPQQHLCLIFQVSPQILLQELSWNSGTWVSVGTMMRAYNKAHPHAGQ
jgi:hypothetical protein